MTLHVLPFQTKNTENEEKNEHTLTHTTMIEENREDVKNDMTEERPTRVRRTFKKKSSLTIFGRREL